MKQSLSEEPWLLPLVRPVRCTKVFSIVLTIGLTKLLPQLFDPCPQMSCITWRLVLKEKGAMNSAKSDALRLQPYSVDWPVLPLSAVWNRRCCLQVLGFTPLHTPLREATRHVVEMLTPNAAERRYRPIPTRHPSTIASLQRIAFEPNPALLLATRLG